MVEADSNLNVLLVTEAEKEKILALIGYLDPANNQLAIRGMNVKVTKKDVTVGAASARRRGGVPGTSSAAELPHSTLQGQVLQALADGDVNGYEFPLSHE